MYLQKTFEGLSSWRILRKVVTLSNRDTLQKYHVCVACQGEPLLKMSYIFTDHIFVRRSYVIAEH